MKKMVVYPQKGKCKTIMNYELWIVYKKRTIAVGSDATSLQYALLSLKIKSFVRSLHALDSFFEMT